MKKLILISVLLCFGPIISFSQDNNTSVTLIVTGVGNTKDEARINGLRNAIELAYSSYVSSKTEILNDELVKDEIITVASGNIVNYKFLKEDLLSNVFYNTMEVTVSVNKLISYAQGKGVTIEFAGSLFGAEIKQQKLNEKAELEAVENICFVYDQLLRKSFNYSIIVSDPKLEQDNNYLIDYEVSSTTNPNYSSAINYLISNLKAISMNVPEIEKYVKIQKMVFRVGLLNKDVSSNETYFEPIVDIDQMTHRGTLRIGVDGANIFKGVEEYLYFRNKESIVVLMNLFIKSNRYPYMFSIHNDFGKLNFAKIDWWSKYENNFPHVMFGYDRSYTNGYGSEEFMYSKMSFNLLFEHDSLHGNFLVDKEKYFKSVLNDYSNYFTLRGFPELSEVSYFKVKAKIPDYNLFVIYSNAYGNESSHFPKAGFNNYILDVMLISLKESYDFKSQFKGKYTLEALEKITTIQVNPIVED